MCESSATGGCLSNSVKPLKKAIDDLTDDLDLSDLEEALEDILNELTTPIQGTIEVGVSTSPETPDLLGYSVYSKQSELNYEGNGFQGLSSYLEVLEQKINQIHADICKAVEPPFVIPNLAPSDCVDILLPVDLDNPVEPILPSVLLREYLVGSPFDFLIDKISDSTNSILVPLAVRLPFPSSQSNSLVSCRIFSSYLQAQPACSRNHCLL